ncbi:hypothetical protein TNCV_1119761 [Trichonephila clavipes]|uniref:Uncharacterized protein n=1 Tax=Trichonephila clavipes TaxID=2585209 RepID=A0A8X6T3R4_TRICX|nr:hypothetical protein TNCV_1119761 [Trichonephila clavipes]
MSISEKSTLGVNEFLTLTKRCLILGSTFREIREYLNNTKTKKKFSSIFQCNPGKGDASPITLQLKIIRSNSTFELAPHNTKRTNAKITSLDSLAKYIKIQNSRSALYGSLESGVLTQLLPSSLERDLKDPCARQQYELLQLGDFNEQSLHQLANQSPCENNNPLIVT